MSDEVFEVPVLVDPYAQVPDAILELYYASI